MVTPRTLVFLLIFGFSPFSMQAQNLTATGAGEASINGTWVKGSDVDGKPSWTKGSDVLRWVSGDDQWLVIDSGELFKEAFYADYYSDDPVADPTLVTTWASWLHVGGLPTFAAVASGPTVTLGVNNALISETGGSATVTATLSAASASNVTVNLGFTGTAAAGDRSLSASSITVTAGQTTGTMTITATGDATDEVDETVVVDITSVTNATESGTQQVTTTIDDDDGPTVTLSGSAPIAIPGIPSMVENGGTGTITATLSAVSPQDVIVTLAYSGTATNGTDYNASASTSVTITAGATTANTAVGITATNDASSEGSEAIQVDITGVTDGTENGTQQINLGILDDDHSPTVTLTRDTATIAENAGVGTFTSTLSDYSANTVTVSLGVGPGETATLNTDYAVGGHPVNIAPGSLTGAMTITATQDTIDEEDELVVVAIQSVTNGTENGTQQQSTTILDDDAAPNVTLAVDNIAIAESAGMATFTATLSAVSAKNVDVEIATVLGTGLELAKDFTETSRTFTINAGSTTGTYKVTAVQDALDEENEGMIVNFKSATNATVVQPSPIIGTSITDDDLPPTVSLALDNGATVKEADNTKSTLTATLSGPSGKAVVVRLKALAGTGGAFDARIDLADPNKNLKIDLATGISFEIPIGETFGNVLWYGSDDTIYESATNETIIFEVDGPGSTNVTAGAPATATLEVVDNDSPPTVSLTTSAASFSEDGGLIKVGASLSHPSHEAITVPIVRDDAMGTADPVKDFGQTGTSVTVPAGSTSGTTDVYGKGDDMYEGDETILYSITSVSAGEATVNAPQAATVTITDSETPPAVTLSVDNSTIAEKGGAARVTATITPAIAVDAAVKLAFSGTATGQLVAASKSTSTGHDYTYSSDTITIKAGETTGTMDIVSVDDTEVERPDPTIIIDVDLGNSTNVSEPAEQQITISMNDDDNAAPVAKDDSGEMNEDETKVFDVLANDTDEDPSSLIISQVDHTGYFDEDSGDFLQVTNVSIVEGGKKISVTTVKDYAGPASISYVIKDAEGVESWPGHLEITVKPVNDPPVANDMTASVQGGKSVTLNPIGQGLATDATDSPSLARWSQHLANQGVMGTSVMHNLSITLVSTLPNFGADGNAVGSVGTPLQTTGGTITLNPDNTFSYAARLLYEGTDTFYYWVSDDGGGFAFDFGKVTVSVAKADGLTDIGGGSNTGQSILITPQAGQNLANVTSTGNNPDPSGTLPTGAVPELGFLNFDVNGIEKGASSTVEITLPPGVKVNNYMKFGRRKKVQGPKVIAHEVAKLENPKSYVPFQSLGGGSEKTFMYTDGKKVWEIDVTTGETVLMNNLNYNPELSHLSIRRLAVIPGLLKIPIAIAEGGTERSAISITRFSPGHLASDYFNQETIVKDPSSSLYLLMTGGHFDVIRGNIYILSAFLGTPLVASMKGVFDFRSNLNPPLGGQGTHVIDSQNRLLFFRHDELVSSPFPAPGDHQHVAGFRMSEEVVNEWCNTRTSPRVGGPFLCRQRAHGSLGVGAVDGSADEARFNGASGITKSGTDIFIADTGNKKIRKMDANGMVSTVAGPVFQTPSGAPIDLKGMNRIIVLDGTIYVFDTGTSAIYRLEIKPPDPIEKEWYVFNYKDKDGNVRADKTGAEFFPAVVNEQGVETSPGRIVLHFVDGERGDDDLEANGVIVDPGFPVFTTNEPPSSTDDEVTLAEDTVTSFNVLTNDTDPEGETIRAFLETLPLQGSVEFSESGQVMYTPPGNYFGTDSFTYIAVDGAGLTSTSTVQITITPMVDSPVANDDVAVTQENTSVDVSIFENDSHPDKELFFFGALAQPSNGTAAFMGDGVVKYTPDPDFSGSDQFTYTIVDNAGQTAVGTVSVSVVNVNAAPAAAEDVTVTDEDTAVFVLVLANDTDSDGDALAVDSFTQGAHGQVTLADDGSLIYTPEANYSGTDSFTYVVGDGSLTSASATVSVTITPVNDAPAFSSDTVIADDGQPVWVGGAIGNDPASLGDLMTVSFWSGAEDIEGDPIVEYGWQLSTTESFEEVLLRSNATETGTRVDWQLILDVMPDLELGMERSMFQRASATDAHGAIGYSNPQPITFVRGLFTSNENEGELPTDFVLGRNYPNPFNPRTTIRFGMPVASDVSLVVYDIMGRHVSTLVDGMKSAGWHEVSFEASDLPSGAYIYRLTSPTGTMTETMMLLK